MSEIGKTEWWKDVGPYIIVPKSLFLDPRYENLSPEAKLLYGFLLDRTSLSATQKDKWKTETGDYYVVYTISEIMERFGCRHDKASKLLNELDAIRLISRTRKNRCQAYRIVVYPVVAKDKSQSSEDLELRGGDTPKTAHNDPKENDPKINTNITTHVEFEKKREEIREQIAYSVLSDRIPESYLDSIIEVMTDTLCSCREEVRIGGKVLVASEIKKRLKETTDMDICYVYDCLQREKKDIYNLHGYILAKLLDADCVKDVAYDRWVRQDMLKTDKEKK